MRGGEKSQPSMALKIRVKKSHRREIIMSWTTTEEYLDGHEALADRVECVYCGHEVPNHMDWHYEGMCYGCRDQGNLHDWEEE